MLWTNVSKEVELVDLAAELFLAIHQEMKANKDYKIMVFFQTVPTTIFFTELANAGAIGGGIRVLALHSQLSQG